MERLSDLPNVGKVLEGHLRCIGIQTPEQLRNIGAKEAFRQIRAYADPGACLHMLYGVQGAVDGIPDKLLPEATRQELKEYFRSLPG